MISALFKVELRTVTSLPLMPPLAPPSMRVSRGRDRLCWLMEYWMLHELMDTWAPFTVNDCAVVDGVVLCVIGIRLDVCLGQRCQL